MISMRAFKSARDSGDYQQCQVVMDHRSESACELGLKKLPEAEAAAMQQSMVSRAIAELAIADDMEAKLETFVDGIADAHFLTPAFGTEITTLAFILRASEDDDEETCAKREVSYKEFKASKTSSFFRPMTMFPEGMKAMARCEGIFLQLQRDRGLLEDADAAVKAAAKIQIPDSGFEQQGESLQLPLKAPMEALQKQYANLRANSSQRFQQTHKDKLAIITTVQDAYHKRVLTATRLFVNSQLAAVMLMVNQVFVGTLKPDEFEIEAKTKLQCTSVVMTPLMQSAPKDNVDRGKVVAMLPAEFVESLDSGMSMLSHLYTVLVAALTWFSNLSRDALAQQAHPLLTWLRIEFSRVTEEDDDGLAKPTCDAIRQFRSLLETWVKEYFGATVKSIMPFIVLLGEDDPEQCFSFDFGAGEASDWEAVSKVSMYVLEEYEPLWIEKTLQNGDDKINLFVACTASRFFQLGLELKAAEGFESLAPATMCEALGKGWTSWVATLAAAETFFGNMPETCETTIADNLVKMLVWQRDKYFKLVQTAFAKVMQAQASTCDKILSTSQDKTFSRFKEIITMEDFYNKDDLIKESLMTCSSKLALQIFEAFIVLDALSKSIAALLKDLETATLAVVLQDTEPFDDAISGLALQVSNQQAKFDDARSQGKLLGNMCVVQALKRDLQPGEIRNSVLQKCEKVFKKKEYLDADPRMRLLLSSSTVATDVALPAA